MKKILCVMFVALLLFTGCSKNGNVKAEPIADKFTAEISYDFNSVHSQAVLTRDGGKTILAYSQPQAINGLTFTKSEDSVSVSFLGIEKEFTQNLIPQRAIIGLVDSALDVVSDEQVSYTLKKSGNQIIYSGECNGNSFELSTSTQSDSVTMLSFPTLNIEIKFNTFIISED